MESLETKYEGLWTKEREKKEKEHPERISWRGERGMQNGVIPPR